MTSIMIVTWGGYIMIIERNNDTVYIEPEGEISFSTVPAIKREIDNFLRQEDKKVVLNLSKIEFVDSKGLGLIISIFKRMKQLGGELIVEYPQLGVQKLIEMTRLDQMFQVIKTPEEKTGDWREFE